MTNKSKKKKGKSKRKNSNVIIYIVMFVMVVAAFIGMFANSPSSKDKSADKKIFDARLLSNANENQFVVVDESDGPIKLSNYEIKITNASYNRDRVILSDLPEELESGEQVIYSSVSGVEGTVFMESLGDMEFNVGQKYKIEFLHMDNQDNPIKLEVTCELIL
jgi:hypothetical protein